MSTDPLSQRKKSASRADMEATILAAAEAVFAEHGYKGATTADIAARAHVPKANLHYYFSTKETLYRTVLGNVLEAWLAAANSFDEGTSPRDALTRYIEAKMDLARQFPLASRIFASEIMRGAPHVQDFLDTTLKAWLTDREIIIQGWIRNGDLRPLEPRTLIYMIWATTQHYADFAHQIATLNGGEELDQEAFAATKRQVVELVLGGVLTADRGAWPAPDGTVTPAP